MTQVRIELGDRSYPIYIENSYEKLSDKLKRECIDGKLVLITDTNVEKHQLPECVKQLQAGEYNVEKYVINPGEKSKNLDVVKDIYSFLVSKKMDRNSALIALGGGVAGDITGFAAATYLRGIRFIQIPVSLLAQADSSVGGKTGVDFKGGKNLIGAFYQPRFVYININSLTTLPKRELSAGLAEVIKHGIIRDEKFFEYIESNIDNIFNYDQDVLMKMTQNNCRIKGQVVEQDEREGGIRAILNFGHTIGHAVESVSGFELLHGECVAIGMAGAFKIAGYLGMIDEESIHRVEQTLVKAGLPVKYDGLDVERVYNQMFLDKKMQGGRIVFILPREIGKVEKYVVKDKKIIKKVLGEIL